MIELVLVGTIAGQRVAFDAAQVEAVIDTGPVVPVPLAPPHVAGLSAARSRVLTVIDARAAIGLDGATDASRAIVVEREGHRYAIRVDAIEDVTAPRGELCDVDPGAAGMWRTAAIGTVDTPSGFALLLDPAALIAGPKPIAV